MDRPLYYTGDENPLVIRNVTADINITASFEPEITYYTYYTVIFNVQANGSITGDTIQKVISNENWADLFPIQDLSAPSGRKQRIKGAVSWSLPIFLTNLHKNP